MTLRTGSASHRSRISRGMLRWPFGERLHIFRAGAVGLVMPLKSASATNLGSTCPICPLLFFQSWSETKLKVKMVMKILMDKMSELTHFFLNSLSSTSLSFTWPHAYVTIVGLSDSLYIAMCTSLWRSDIISTTTWVLNVWRAQIKLKSKS